jgi:predicted RNA polymerase sigma factor
VRSGRSRRSGCRSRCRRPADLPARLSAVLAVVYLVFNEGYSASAGSLLQRVDLAREALELGTLLAELLPDEPEVHGLMALMELQTSRSAARTDAAGEIVLLEDQDRSRWDQARIARGLAWLARSRALDDAGPYRLQAEIAGCHATASSWAATDWRRIATLYAALARVTPSPVVELNRAVAVALAEGPAAGLAIVDGLREVPSLRDYHLLPSTRADLLRRLGRFADARAEYERALSLTANRAQQAFIARRIAECDRSQTVHRPVDARVSAVHGAARCSSTPTATSCRTACRWRSGSSSTTAWARADSRIRAC